MEIWKNWKIYLYISVNKGRGRIKIGGCIDNENGQSMREDNG